MLLVDEELEKPFLLEAAARVLALQDSFDFAGPVEYLEFVGGQLKELADRGRQLVGFRHQSIFWGLPSSS